MSNDLFTENLVARTAVTPRRDATASTLYNGSVDGATCVGIDTMKYDEAAVLLQAGLISSGTLACSIFDSSVGTTSVGASAITGADFTTLTAENYRGSTGVFIGSIKTKNTKRYLYVKTVLTVADAKDFGVTVLLGKGDGAMPVTQGQTVAFAV
jgi:hypothetical protein